MGIFSTSSPFDSDIEKITDEKNTDDDWGLILDLCDRVSGATNGPKDCLRSIMKRLNHQDPHVILKAVTLLDACVNNCGRNFKLEVASAEFEKDFKKLLVKAHKVHPKVADKLKEVLKKWAEGDFKNDPQLALIPSLYNSLKREGFDFNLPSSGAAPQTRSSAASKNPDVVSSRQEEDDIAKAIQLSLAESKSSPTQARSSSQLYPSTTGDLAGGAVATAPTKEQKKARALYDFEAAEDNELTFKAGEIVIVIDDNDVNWWKGSNHRGEGLFPANFVTTDLEAPPEDEQPKRRRSVQFNEEVEVKTLPHQEVGPVEISEERIDNVLMLLNDADPTNPDTDPPELGLVEEQVNSMGPLIDTELESIDRRHAQLTRISTELVDALNLYHQLMHEMPVHQPQMPGGYMMHGGHAPAAPYPGAYNPAMYGNPIPGSPMPAGQGYPPNAGGMVGHPEMTNGTQATYPGYAAPPQAMAPNTTMPAGQQDQQHQVVPPLDQSSQMSNSSVGSTVNNQQPYYTNATVAHAPPATTQSDMQNQGQQQPFATPMAPQSGIESYAMNGATQPPVGPAPTAFPHPQVPPMN